MKTTIIVATLALALATLASPAYAAGTGMPMMKGLKDPTVLASLVESALKRDLTGNSLLDPARCKKDGSCATAHDYFYGIQVAHPSAKLGDIAELPRYLRSLVKQPAPTGEWYMSRLLVKGEKRTYDHMAWHRAFFKGEDVWDDPNTGEHVLAGFCENVVGKLKSPVAEKETPVKVRDTAPAVVAQPPPNNPVLKVGCPNGRTLTANAWSLKALPEELRKKAEGHIDMANARESAGGQNLGAYQTDALSRTLGKRLREEVKTRALVVTDIIVGYVDINPRTKQVVTRDIGTLQMVGGIGTFRFSDDPRTHTAVEVAWPTTEFVSPTISGGFRRLRVFPNEWGTWCSTNVHGLVP